MIGHRRPSLLIVALARIALVLCAVVSCHATAQEPDVPNEPIRLRISWGGGDANPWVGKIRLDQGSLSDLKLLGLDADAAGSIWIDQDQVRIGSLSPHRTDGIEAIASASSNGRLTIELAAGPKAIPAQAQVPLADLTRRPYQLRLDDRGNTLDVRVVPNATLDVSIKNGGNDRDPLIFAPGTQLSCELTPVLAAALHGTTLDVQSTLTPARGKDAVWKDTQRLAVPVVGQPKVNLAVPLQVPEGVYTVHIAVARSSGYLRDKFFPGAAPALAERSFQIVVLDSHPAANVAGHWEPVLEIDPTNPRWVDKLPAWTQLRRIPGFNHGPLGSIRANSVDLALGRFIELPPATPGADPQWQAYSLPVEAIGVPHLLEIDYPADEEQHFGLSIVEPNAAGVVEGIQRDAGVYVEGLGRSEEKQKQTQRLMFWPRTQAPLLIVTNEHPTAAAHFGQIRVLKREGSLDAAPASASSHDRLVAAYLSTPSLAQSFGATETLDATEVNSFPKSVADYHTFYEGATRLSGYLHHAGYNSAVLSVLADGSSIYPSAHLLPTPRYETGRFSNRLRDIDGLELTLRVFDRERLTLIPAIEFTTPIPELESLRRTTDPHSAGLELVGPDGHTWLETNGNRAGLAPYYNVLDPRVQNAMLAVVDELVRRYGKHAAFGGLAVQLTSDGYSQLPPLDWGLDDTTVARFAKESGLKLDATGPDRFEARHAALTGPYATAWRTWRATQVAGFYSRMASLVHDNGERRLLLTTERLFDHPQVKQVLRPNLLVDSRIETRVSETALELGLDRQLLERIPGLVFSPASYVEPTMPLPDRAIDLELNAAFTQWNASQNAIVPIASILFSRSSQFRLASFERSSPFRLSAETRFSSQPTPSAAAREPYVRACLQGDPTLLLEGGNFSPIGQDESLRAVRTLLAELPTSAQISETSKQPLVVRTYTENGQVTVLILNAVPWHVNAELTFDVVQPTANSPVVPAESSSEDPIKSLTLPAGHQPWKAALAPYDIRAIRIAAASVKVVDIRSTLDDTAVTELKRKLDSVASRDISAPRSYNGAANPSFEPVAGGGALPGWHLVGNSRTASAVLDPNNPQDGKTSICIRNSGQFVALESDPFPIPATGQLALTVFARGENMGPDSELRLVVESNAEGESYRREGSPILPINGSAPVQHRLPTQWDRAPFAILVPDLPLTSQGQMRIKFELTGPGEIWLDNVKLNELLFPLKFYPNYQGETFQLLRRSHEVQAAFDEGRVQDCVRMLEGYWPQFLLAYSAPSAPAVALAPDVDHRSVAPDAAPDKSNPSTPGIGDRLKRMVPILR